MHPIALALGVLAMLAGLTLVVIGGIATILTPTGFLPVGLGILLIGGGGVVTLAGAYL